MFYAYIMTNKPNGTLYLGQTENLTRRMWEHQNKMIPGFTKKYNLTKLVWYEVFNSRDDALATEIRIKAWKRVWKIEEIEKRNPEWSDLAQEI
jgi:putative endonuclease